MLEMVLDWQEVTCSLYVPAGHGVNAISALMAPSDAQKPPLGQGVQLVEPEVAE